MSVFLALWLTTAIGAALIARFKGSSFSLWFIYGFLFGVIALVHAIFLRGERKDLMYH
jgi:hypothetical protein